MGSTIYTRKGDKGDTSLVNGDRVAKDSPRVESYGTVEDLLKGQIGWFSGQQVCICTHVLSEGVHA